MKNAGEVLGEDADGEPIIMVGIDHETSASMVRLDIGMQMIFMPPGPARSLAFALLRYAEFIRPLEDTEDIH
jgi:hypothetical protein